MEGTSPLDDAQRETLMATKTAKRKLKVAGFIALSNVVGLGLCALFAIAFGSLDPGLLPIGLVLVALAWNEWRGRALLLEGDGRAPRRLALNQLALLIAVLVYCVHSGYVAWTSPSLLDAMAGADPELREVLGGGTFPFASGTGSDDLGEWARTATLVVYGAVAAGSLVVQGLTAAYYLSLRRAVATYAAAPAWARELS
jgi:hypothetical protein